MNFIKFLNNESGPIVSCLECNRSTWPLIQPNLNCKITRIKVTFISSIQTKKKNTVNIISFIYFSFRAHSFQWSLQNEVNSTRFIKLKITTIFKSCVCVCMSATDARISFFFLFFQKKQCFFIYTKKKDNIFSGPATYWNIAAFIDPKIQWF